MPPPNQQVPNHIYKIILQARNEKNIPFNIKITQPEINAASQEFQKRQQAIGLDPTKTDPTETPQARIEKLREARRVLIRRRLARDPNTDPVNIAEAERWHAKNPLEAIALPARVTSSAVLYGIERANPFWEGPIERGIQRQRMLSPSGGIGAMGVMRQAGTARYPRFVRGGAEAVLDPLNLVPMRFIEKPVGAGLGLGFRGARALPGFLGRGGRALPAEQLIRGAKPETPTYYPRRASPAQEQLIPMREPDLGRTMFPQRVAEEVPVERIAEEVPVAGVAPSITRPAGRRFKLFPESPEDYDNAILAAAEQGADELILGPVRRLQIFDQETGEPLLAIAGRKVPFGRNVFEVEVRGLSLSGESLPFSDEALRGAFNRRELLEIADDVMNELGADELIGFRLGRDAPDIRTARSITRAQVRQGLGRAAPEEGPIIERGGGISSLPRTAYEARTGRQYPGPQPGVTNRMRLARGEKFARGKQALKNRIDLEYRVMKSLDPVTRYAADEFLDMLPDHMVEDLGSSYITRISDRDVGRRARIGLATPVGTYEPDIALINIFKRLSTGEVAGTERVIVHEVAHHLEQFVPSAEAKKLVSQFRKEMSDRGQSIIDEVTELRKNKAAEARAVEARELAKREGYLTPEQLALPQEVKPLTDIEEKLVRDSYRYTNFQEWFAEVITDKALRDILMEIPEKRNVIQRVLDAIKELAISAYRTLLRRGATRDEAERVYKNLINNEFDPAKRRSLLHYEGMLEEVPDLSVPGTTRELFDDLSSIPSARRGEVKVGISPYIEPASASIGDTATAKSTSPWWSEMYYAAKRQADDRLASKALKDRVWGERVYGELVEPPARYMEHRLRDVASEVEVSPNFGLFGGYIEPSMVIRATAPSAQQDDFIRAIVDIADIDFNQAAVLIHKQADLGNRGFGYFPAATERQLAYSIEPMLTFKAGKRKKITGAQFLRLQKIADKAGLPGFASTPDKKGIEILNVSRYGHDVQAGRASGDPLKPYDTFMENVDKFRKGIEDDEKLRGLFTGIDADVRQLWHFGNRDNWGEGLEHVGRNTGLSEYQYDAVRGYHEAKHGLRSADSPSVGLDEPDRIALAEKRAGAYEAETGVSIPTRQSLAEQTRIVDPPGVEPYGDITEVSQQHAQIIGTRPADMGVGPPMERIRDKGAGVTAESIGEKQRRLGVVPDNRRAAVYMQDEPAMKKLEELFDKGLKIGGFEWYNPELMRKSFIAELGPVEGHRKFMRFLPLLAATSPRATVPSNIKVASFYEELISAAEHGTPMSKAHENFLDVLHDISRYAGEGEFAVRGAREQPRPPYGHLAAQNHAKGVLQWLRGEWNDPDKLTNPKILSFLQSFLGHPEAVAIDAHAMRAIGMSSSNKVEWLAGFKPIDEKVFKAKLQALRTGKGKHSRPKYGVGLSKLKPFMKETGSGKYKQFQFNAKEAVRAKKGVDIEDIQDFPSVWQEAFTGSSRERGAPEYGFAEEIFGEIARRKSAELGVPITYSQAQASIWTGAAEATGVAGESRGNFTWALREALVSAAERDHVPVLQKAHDFFRGIAIALMAVAGGEGTRRLLGTEEEPVATGAAQ
jgi:hypothetical protein